MVPPAQTACAGGVTPSEKSAAPALQAGRVPQAMPCALNASQIRQAFGVPLARLPSSSSAATKTVYQLVAPQPLTVADGLHWPPLCTW